MTCAVVAEDARSETEIAELPVDLPRWARLAERAANTDGGVGELTLTLVDRSEIADLNAEHMGKSGPTDVLSFPMDDEPVEGIPTMLGDIVLSPAVAAEQFGDHAGTLDDELALLVVHGVLHILGYDHADPDEAAAMRARELDLLSTLHWSGPAPAGFRQTHS